MKKRVEYIDLIRVFALFSVIAIHVNAITRDTFIQTNPRYYFFFTFLDSITRAGVPLFFMLTGYFVLNGKEEMKTFWKKKLPKLIIPFVLFSFFYYLYQIHEQNTPFHLLDFIVRFLNNTNYYHLWYMYVIILIYLFIPYERVLVQNLKRKDLLRLIMIIGILGNLFLTIYLFSNKYSHPVLRGFVLPDLIIYNNYLFLGYYLSQYELKHKKWIYLLGVFSLLWMPMLDFYFIAGERNDVLLTAVSILPVFYALSVYSLIKDFYGKIKWNKHIQKIIHHISSLSLYIYLSHVLVMNFIIKVLRRYWICDRFYENILFTIIVWTGTTILSYFLSIGFDCLYRKGEHFTKSRK